MSIAEQQIKAQLDPVDIAWDLEHVRVTSLCVDTSESLVSLTLVS